MTRLLYLLDLAGVAVFAASGALAAMASGMDLLGVLVLASVTAVGGGTIRDLLLNRHPVFWIQDSRPLLVITVAALVTVVWSRLLPIPMHALLVADALGLALFAMSGARLAAERGCSSLVTIFMGTLTGVGGGAVRDVLTAKVPLILRQDIYASAAIAGIGAYLLLRRTGLTERAAFFAGLAVVVALRLAAVSWGWQLPSFRNS
ncbi:MAG: trimeric intracellular cation channel family protein [Pseudomonadota bacterium]